MVLDWGVHMLDQIMMMVEKPLRSVYAILSHVTNDDVDDGFKIFLDFEGGLNVQVEVGTSNFINLPRWYMQGTTAPLLCPTGSRKTAGSSWYPIGKTGTRFPS